jgi:hypothetical protein
MLRTSRSSVAVHPRPFSREQIDYRAVWPTPALLPSGAGKNRYGAHSYFVGGCLFSSVST